MHNIETGQAVLGQLTPTDSSVSITNPKIRADINIRLATELNDIILSPVNGVQKVRKVLARFGLDIPALYDLDSEGDEIVIKMDQYGNVYDPYHMPQFDTKTTQSYYLYLLYHLSDGGDYKFHAEIADEDKIEDMFKDDEGLEQEDDV